MGGDVVRYYNKRRVEKKRRFNCSYRRKGTRDNGVTAAAPYCTVRTLLLSHMPGCLIK